MKMKAKLIKESLNEYELGRNMFDNTSSYDFRGSEEEFFELVDAIRNNQDQGYYWDIGYSDQSFKIDQDVDINEIIPPHLLDKIFVLKR